MEWELKIKEQVFWVEVVIKVVKRVEVMDVLNE